MSRKLLLKDHIPGLTLNIAGMLLLVLFLLAIGVSAGEAGLIVLVWLGAVILFYGVTICRKHRQLQQLVGLADGLEKKYLLAEVMEKPENEVEAFYYQLLKSAGKSMMEQVNKTDRESKEYRAYIEQWIHEVKTPIAGIGLLCAHNRPEWSGRLLAELAKLDHLVEQTLYYARSEDTAKDYIVRETLISEIVHAAVQENRQLLRSLGVQVVFEENDTTVYTDKKWVVFILNQLIHNAVQYRRQEPCFIQFCTEEAENGVILKVKDNGVGISASELPRIFEKGYTGTNGRKIKKSTGFGLFISEKLCNKLGLLITAQSIEGEGTEFELFFPKGTFSVI